MSCFWTNGMDVKSQNVDCSKSVYCRFSAMIKKSNGGNPFLLTMSPDSLEVNA